MPTENITPAEAPRSVACERRDGAYRITVDGEPFFVKGAGGAHARIENLASHGANSLRTWSTANAAEVLDAAQRSGIMVLMGLRMVPERHGFDYDDEAAVREQLERVEAEVRAYKDHPALLAWGIGNELNLSYENPAVWDAVNDIARMIHEVDPNHPATTMLAGVKKPVFDEIARRCPDVDFLSIQMYGNVALAKEKLREVGYEGPYLITEWGATGHWEVPQTEWGAPIEQTSSEKADAIRERYEAAVMGDAERCMGSYVFVWGQKQERTPTWYGLFTEDGRETEAIDAMEYLWTGSWPAHRAPRFTGIAIGGKTRYDSVRLAPGKAAVAELAVEAAKGAQVSVHAEILSEATVLGEGGDYEPRPEAVPGLIRATGVKEVEFDTPSEPGAYRLFVTILDDHNHAAVANMPFLVE